MGNAHLIEHCDNCSQDYCCTCSEADDWANFCSKECEKEWRQDMLKIAETHSILQETNKNIKEMFENE